MLTDPKLSIPVDLLMVVTKNRMDCDDSFFFETHGSWEPPLLSVTSLLNRLQQRITTPLHYIIRPSLCWSSARSVTFNRPHHYRTVFINLFSFILQLWWYLQQFSCVYHILRWTSSSCWLTQNCRCLPEWKKTLMRQMNGRSTRLHVLGTKFVTIICWPFAVWFWILMICRLVCLVTV